MSKDTLDLDNEDESNFVSAPDFIAVGKPGISKMDVFESISLVMAAIARAQEQMDCRKIESAEETPVEHTDLIIKELAIDPPNVDKNGYIDPTFVKIRCTVARSEKK